MEEFGSGSIQNNNGPGSESGGPKPDHCDKAWMKEEKGIIHQGWGAHLRCPVCTSVQFSLPNKGSTEYMCVRGEISGGGNIYRCQSVCPVVLKDFDFLKKI